jgi:spore maturation protein CgeB
MHLTFFGSSLVSSYWNGAATYYRGLLRALHGLGHEIVFCEPDAYGRQQNRDLERDPAYACVVVYRSEPERDRLVEQALAESDWVVKCSGVGVWDAELEQATAAGSGARAATAFLDVDAPATLARLEADPADGFRACIPRYDHVLTYGGGPRIVERYLDWGARACTPVYNALDPDEHRPVDRNGPPEFDLLFMGNRLPDREARVDEFFLRAAALCPAHRFALGGEGWGDKPMPANVTYLGHVPTARHNQVNASARLVLNIHRDSMVENGWSPATRMFEAAGAACCQVTDAWRGLGDFFAPDAEILVAHDADDVAHLVRTVDDARPYLRSARGAAGPRPSRPGSRRVSHGRLRTAHSALHTRSMKLVVFGLSLSSSWGNGHATTYRALLRAFAARGHEVSYFEWDAPWYGGAHRDLPDPSFCRLVLYGGWEQVASDALAEAREADAVIVGSYVHRGPEIIDALAEAGASPLYFYDIDTPVTVAALRRGGAEYLRADQVPLFEAYLSFTGGPFLPEVVERQLGARRTAPLYCSVDVECYRPVEPDPALGVALGYMGTYAPDRQPVIERLLIEVARRLPERRFLIAGPQYPEAGGWPGNILHLQHLPPVRHPVYYSSALWQLNATRADMVAAGWSPSVRLFEAAACGAPLISDRWPGIEAFFEPGREVLLPGSTDAVVEILRGTHDDDRRALGQAARARILAAHTAEHRAAELESLLRDPVPAAAGLQEG